MLDQNRIEDVFLHGDDVVQIFGDGPLSRGGPEAPLGVGEPLGCADDCLTRLLQKQTSLGEFLIGQLGRDRFLTDG